ncbi:Lin0512 family protein [Hydrogenophaga sp.]
MKRVVTQFGMGTSIRSRNYTEAAARAIRDALWHNLYGRLPCGKRFSEVLTRRVHCGLISGLSRSPDIVRCWP